MLQGKSIIGWSRATGGYETLYGHDARTGERLEPAYHGATAADMDRAVSLAADAFPPIALCPVPGARSFCGRLPRSWKDWAIRS